MSKGKESKYDLILETAFKLFIEKGYTNTKIIEIANEAGIGKGTVYEYFNSKESLACEIFHKKIIPLYQEMKLVIQDDMNCKEKLEAAINYELEAVSQFGNNKNILSNFMLETEFLQNKELIRAMHDLMELKFQFIYDIIKEGIRKGEFIKIDPLMATLSIAGAIGYFISYGFDFILPFGELGKEKTSPWNKNEFFRLLFGGLLVN